jgi:WD40-like Beta Propeller Repeat
MLERMSFRQRAECRRGRRARGSERIRRPRSLRGSSHWPHGPVRDQDRIDYVREGKGRHLSLPGCYGAADTVGRSHTGRQIPSNNVIPTDWSPDAQTIIFSGPSSETGNDLWLLPLAQGKKPEKFIPSPAEQMHAAFSPNGHLVAYTSNESGRFEVYVETIPQSDRKLAVSTGGGYEPRWRADGTELYYLSEDRKLMAVRVSPGPSFGVPKMLFQTRVPAGITANRNHYVPSSDGQRFLVNTQIGDAQPTPITVVLNWSAGLSRK